MRRGKRIDFGMWPALCFAAVAMLWGSALAREYAFQGPISREVLENYLSRSITMLDLLTERGDFEDNLRMLRDTGAKFAGRTVYRWGREADLPAVLATARKNAARVHAADPEMILQAAVFEIVSEQVEQLPIPARVFEAFGRSVERRNFRYDDMLYPGGRGRDQWWRGASVPDVSRPETKLWLYYLATEYIDIGCEAIHFGQAEIMDGNDAEHAHWRDVLQRVRQYAAKHARRGWVVCDAHTPGGGLLYKDELLLDFHSFPLRIVETPDEPKKGILKMGAFDSIYGRSKGGVTPSGWRCEHLPYLVELDNWGVSGRPGKPHAGSCWVWGYDEISWFAHQDAEYRSEWLQYAWDWVREHDPNGWLQMPGSRILHAPVNSHGWYYANRRSEAVPHGFGDEDTIRAIWTAHGEKEEKTGPRVGKVRPDKRQVDVYERLTLEIDLQAEYENPFDARQIRVDVEAKGPHGREWTAPAFLYQPYRRDDSAKNSRWTVPAGEPRWQGRLSFDEPGDYILTIAAKDRNGTARSEPVAVAVEAADRPGMIRRHPRDHRYFATDRGETWFASGANVCWGETWGNGRHVFAYDEWFPKYAAAGCNYARLWLSLEWNDLALITQASGYDRIDLQRAWHLDHVLDLAEEHDLRLMLCFDAHGMLRSREHQHGFWEMSALHPDHGAPIEKPIEFFTNEEMLAAYRNRLRYLVARYGCSPSVFAWEFFNEVDLVDEYDSRLVADWHRAMARHLRSLDPWRHLITTSYARPTGDPAVDGLKELDFVQTHHYQARDIVAEFQRDIAGKSAAKDRPHVHGEFGISHSGRETGEMDPGGIHLHNGLYSSVGLMSAGTAMTWWWDSYVNPRDLYPIWAAFNKWTAGFDFGAQQVRPTGATLRWAAGATPPKMDMVLNVSDQSWQPAPYNRPLTVAVDSNGRVKYQIRPAGLLHGRVNHPDLHNPVTFNLDLPRPSRFIVDVGGVSGHGGAVLQILVDGKEALRAEMIDPENPHRGGTLNDFAGSYGVDVPAGRHEIVVQGIGRDWLMVDAYRIPGVVIPETPPLRVLGAVGRTEALLWVQNPEHTWSLARTEDFSPTTIEDVILELPGLASGVWRVEYWDTAGGQVVRRASVRADGESPVAVELPTVRWDLALRLKKH